MLRSSVELGFELAVERSDFGSGGGWKDEAKGYLAGLKRMERIAQRPITMG